MGYVKVNVDAAIINGVGTSLGAVISGDDGDILAVGVHCVKAGWKVSLGEAMAARFGVCLAQQLGYRKVMLEGDACNIIEAIQRSKEVPRRDYIGTKCLP
ncbi:Glycine betaine transport system permease protein OpuAB [Bienertia sinuspersici]